MTLIDHERLPRGIEKTRAVRGMFDAIAPRYDLVNRLMTFGLDVSWRRRAVRALALPPGSRVLDLGSGTGDFCRELTRAGMRPLGVDLSHGMLAHARTDAPLVQADASALPLPSASVDGATSGFVLRNLSHLEACLSELTRVVRPGGRVALLDVAEPPNPVLRVGHGIYFDRVVPRLGGLLSDGSAYRYLPKSVEYLPEPDELHTMLERTGLVGVERRLLTGGITQLLLGTRGHDG